MEKQYGELWPAIKKVKRLFDPSAILNPGKLVSDWVHRCDDNLRQVSTEIHVVHGDRDLIQPANPEVLVAEMSSNPVRKLSVIQDWGISNRIEQVVRSCNGCGRAERRLLISGNVRCFASIRLKKPHREPRRI